MRPLSDVAPVAHGIDAGTDDLVWIAGGECQIGSDLHYENEQPAHRRTVGDFWIDRYPVTNARFAEFVEATGYVTIAERPPDLSDYPDAVTEFMQPGSLVFVQPTRPVDLHHAANWWGYVFGASWRHPQGLESSLEGLGDHPVVHVAYGDVEAYAAWAGKQIPSEAEWEFAARGGLDGAEYAWGDEFMPAGKIMANTWQGRFPYENLCLDGYDLTSPVNAFPPNGYGVSDMIGNVWEWTSDWYRTKSPAKPDGCCGNADPRSACAADSYDPALPSIRIPRKVVKGGSHLCAPNYCRRYRPAARHPQMIDSSMSHIGFRCIVRPAP
jgi:formylglycine-generating enzyme